MRWVCLFLETIEIETRFRRCQAKSHPHFVVNSKKFLSFFTFNFCQQKIHIHRALKMQMTRLF